jgi:hypothetical protein
MVAMDVPGLLRNDASGTLLHFHERTAREVALIDDASVLVGGAFNATQVMGERDCAISGSVFALEAVSARIVPELG